MTRHVPRFEHWRLVRRHEIEVARFRSALRLAGRDPSILHDISVEHDADDRCCRREPWPVTFAALLVEPQEASR